MRWQSSLIWRKRREIGDVTRDRIEGKAKDKFVCEQLVADNIVGNAVARWLPGVFD